MSDLLRSVRKATYQFNEDDCLTSAASVAFYTLFALPPLLYLLAIVISSGMAGLYEFEDSRDRARDFLQGQASQLIGDRAAAVEVGNMLENVGHRTGVWWKSIVSLVGVFIGATGVMSALQSSLNHVWKVRPNPSKGFAVRFLIKRFLSLAMIMGFGFVLLVSFIISSFLAIIGKYTADRLGLGGVLPAVFNHSLTFVVAWIFFAGIFKFMPDARVSLKNSMVGGLFTVTAFTVGRVILFFYFQISDPGAQLGSAAGAIAILLLWVYYSTVILLFGAEFTYAYSTIHGERTEPEEGAVEVAEEIVQQ